MSIVRVAQLANVSPATVSRVINNSPQVTADLTARVQSAMRDIGYVPPPKESRRGPKSTSAGPARTGQIAMLAFGMDQRFVLGATNVIVQAIASHDLHLLVTPVNDPDSLPSVITKRKVDGVILQGLEPTGAADTFLRQFPTVWFMSRHSRTYWADFVEPDNWANGLMAADYLLKRGHTCLAIADFQPAYPAFRSRDQAFASAVGDTRAQLVKAFEAGACNDLVLRPDSDGQEMRQLAEVQAAHIMNSSPRPTGLYIPYAGMAPTMFFALERHGLVVGKDLEVVIGDYDDRMAWWRDGPVAQIDINSNVIAQKAIEQLIWRMENPLAPGPVGMAVAPRLIIGDRRD